MSRSKKKHPVVSDYSRNYTPHAKRMASKAVRRYPHKIADGNSYRKVFPSYNIFDYKCHWFLSDLKEYDWFSVEDIKAAYRK